ncbi:MAG: tetratricopeptide repeat protein [Bacteroidia bacterium]|nr:tetratricopeptide repeat protein [Bacteroidia bacterium]
MKSLSFLLLALLLILFSCSGEQPADQTNIPADLKALNERIAKDSLNAEFYYDRSQYYFKSQDAVNAVMDIRKAIQLDSAKTKYHLAMGDYHFAMNKTGVTIQCLRKAAVLEPSNNEILLKLGELFYIVMKYDSAVFYVNRSLALEETNPKAHFQKGMILKESGDTTNALISFQTAVDQDQNYYDAFIQLGMLHERMGNNISLGYFDNAVRILPNSTEARYFKAMYFQSRGKSKEAGDIYDEILKLDSAHVNSIYNKGFLLLEVEKNAGKALRWFDRAYQLDPHYADAIYMRGLCHEKTGDNQLAAKDYNAALILQPEHPQALEGLKRLKVK